ncbi:hypothetical protein Athai_27420 [Actinocatenispora thailandica]|uniref:Uncharacterized protein n=1 Tax=Actinocatenispora thailandica TaxID=227318 RepID=A0A7R7HXM5_9ACTN|nr:hypothetical protein [Actinocatenispora thailandica]BCJ35239.1 hypothetical protein Athai_27420 [Actinocatenispora thailandica]
MALDGAAGPSDGPQHAIDGEGTATTPDLAVGDSGRHLQADAKHLADVARELSNLADYLDRDLGKAAKQIVELSGRHAQHHYGGAMKDWNNPSGRFSDADYLWGRYGAAAASTRDFGTSLASAVQQLADGTELIAKRYRSTEARNRLLAKQVESLLASSGASGGSATAAGAYGTAGADPAGDAQGGASGTGGTGADGSGGTGAGDSSGADGGSGTNGGSDTSGAGDGGAGSTGGYGGGGGA